MSQPLTDALLGAVLRMGPYMRRLSVPSLALQSDQHANTPWPWEELSVGALDLAQFGRLPDTTAAQSQANVEVRCDLSVGADIFQASELQTRTCGQHARGLLKPSDQSQHWSRVCVCVYVCVCALAHARYRSAHSHMYSTLKEEEASACDCRCHGEACLCVCARVCVCVCVCVCVHRYSSFSTISTTNHALLH